MTGNRPRRVSRSTGALAPVPPVARPDPCSQNTSDAALVLNSIQGAADEATRWLERARARSSALFTDTEADVWFIWSSGSCSCLESIRRKQNSGPFSLCTHGGWG